MILFPKLRNQPYSNHKLKKLIKKYDQIAGESPEIYIKEVVRIIYENYEESDLIDSKMIESLLYIFSVEKSHDAMAEIFSNSILKETLILNEYHTIKHLKNDLLSLLNNEL